MEEVRDIQARGRSMQEDTLVDRKQILLAGRDVRDGHRESETQPVAGLLLPPLELPRPVGHFGLFFDVASCL